MLEYDVMLLSMLMILLSICDQWQQLELASELNLIYETLWTWAEVAVDFNAGKTQLVSIDQSNDTGVNDVKMDGSVLEEKLSFKMLGMTFFSKLDWGSYIISITKTAFENIGAFLGCCYLLGCY